jgi:hypothetical protein
MASGDESRPRRVAAEDLSVEARRVSEMRAAGSEYARHSGTGDAATGAHDASGTSATAFSPAAFPATVPLDHAHWKLNPPSLPSTSSSSPHR